MAALGETGEQHRLKIRAGGIDRGGIAGRPRTEDQQAAMFRCFGHEARADLTSGKKPTI
ncbi:hypothetical protein D3C83_40820 [compost metagenome]